MASLASIVSKHRQAGKGVAGSLSGGIKEKLKETFDPRRMINQKGLLPALFPKLRAFKAKGVDSPGVDLSSPSLDVSSLTSPLQKIESDTKIEAKNSMVFPMMHRDFNIMRQNIIKLVKLEGGTPATKADTFFMSASDRQKAFEAQSTKPTKKEDEKRGSKTGTFLMTAGLILLGGYILKEMDILSKETIKNSIENFITILTGSSNASASIMRNMDSSGLQGKTFNSLTKQQQEDLLTAQAKGEGAEKSGTLANRMNNPGAIIVPKGGAIPEYAKQYGAELGESNEAGTMLKFPSMEKGRAAQRKLWETHYADKSLDEALSIWTTGRAGNKASYASMIAQAIGVQPQTGTSSGFGQRFDPLTGKLSQHKGVDIPAAQGTPVTATASGEVTKAEWENPNNPSQGYGQYIEITHPDGSKTKYGHLATIGVRLNQKVEAGQTIGQVGSTGHSTGPHLHYEVIKNGSAVDPALNPISSISPVAGTKLDGATLAKTSGQLATNEAMTPVSAAKSVLNILNNNTANFISQGKPMTEDDMFGRLFSLAK